jgi:hypothetical protein
MTMPFRRIAALAVAALGATVGLAACSEPLSSGPPPSTTAAPTTTTIPGAATPAQTKASDYRAQLTYLMVEQVYLLDRVTQELIAGVGAASSSSSSSASAGATTTLAPTTTTTTVASGSGSSGSGSSAGATTTTSVPAVTPPSLGAVADDAATALDQNSHDISDWLSRAQGYGSSFDTAFYELWTQRNEDFEAYAVAKAAGDSTGQAAATAALAANATAIGTLIHQTNQYVEITTLTNPATGMADEINPDNQAIQTVIDDQAAGAASHAADLVTAAERMYHTADYLAAAAAKLDPNQYPGTAAGTAANVRASVVMVMVEHVELVMLDLDRQIVGGNTAPWSAALVANTGEMANILAVNYTDQTGEQFTSIWSNYIAALSAYAKAKSAGDDAAAAAAATTVNNMPPLIGNLIHGADDPLSSAQVSGDLAPIASGLLAAIDAAASGSPQVTLIRAAAGHIPQFGSDVGEAIAIAQPNLYAP